MAIQSEVPPIWILNLVSSCTFTLKREETLSFSNREGP